MRKTISVDGRSAVVDLPDDFDPQDMPDVMNQIRQARIKRLPAHRQAVYGGAANELFDENTLQQIRNGSPTVRAKDGKDYPLSSMLRLYGKVFGQGVQGKSNKGTESEAYAGGQGLDPYKARLGGGQHNSNVYHGAQELVGGSVVGLVNAQRAIAGDRIKTPMKDGRQLSQAIGTWVLNLGPQFFSGLGSEDPEEHLRNLAGGAALHMAFAGLAHSIPGFQLDLASRSAKKLGYSSLHEFVEKAPEAARLRSRINAEASKYATFNPAKPLELLGKPKPSNISADADLKNVNRFLTPDATKIGTDLERAQALAAKHGVNPEIVTGFDSQGRLKGVAKAGKREFSLSKPEATNINQSPTQGPQPVQTSPAPVQYAQPQNPTPATPVQPVPASNAPAGPQGESTPVVPALGPKSAQSMEALKAAHGKQKQSLSPSPVAAPPPVDMPAAASSTSQTSPATTPSEAHSALPDATQQYQGKSSIEDNAKAQATSTLHAEVPESSSGSPASVPGNPTTVEAAEDGGVHSTKNAVTAHDRESFGLDQIEKPERQSFEGWLKEARDSGLNSSENTRKLADRVLGGDEHAHLNEIENAAVADRMAHLKTEHQSVTDKIAEAIESGATPDDLTDLRNEQGSLEQEFDHLSKATTKGGTRLGRMLAARKLTLNNDFKLISVINRAVKSKGDSLTSEEREGFEKMVKDLESRIEEGRKLMEERDKEYAVKDRHISRMEKYIADQKGSRTFAKEPKLPTQGERERIQATRKDAAQKFKEAYEKAKNEGHRFNRQSGAISIPLSPEMLEHLGTVIKSHIDEGILNVKELTEKTNETFKELGLHLGITEPELVKAFDSFAVARSKKTVVSDKAKFVQILRLHGQLQKALEGELDQSPKATRVTDEEIKDLRKKIKEARDGASPKSEPHVKAFENGLSALEKSREARLSKQIEKLESGEPLKNPPIQGPDTEAVANLKKRVAELKEERKALNPNKDAKRIQSIEAKIKEAESEIASKFVSGKALAKEPSAPNIQDALNRLQKVRRTARLDRRVKLLDHIANLPDDKFMEAANKLESDRAERSAKLKDGRDKEWIDNRFRVRSLERSINKRIEKLRPKTAFERISAGLLGLQRFNMVSGLGTFGKVAGTSLMNFATAPIEHPIGKLIGAVSPKFRSLTPEVQGNLKSGFSGVKALGKSIVDKDWLTKARTGMNSLDKEAFAKGLEAPQMEGDLASFVYRLHGALTTPAQRAAFASESEKIAQTMVKNGENPASEENAAKIFTKAYEASLRSIGYNENAAAAMIGNGLRNIGKVSPVTENAIRSIVVPFTRIPTNAVGRKLESTVLGVLYGAAKLGWHLHAGTLDEKSAGEIARAFKRGGTGTGLMALGYYLTKNHLATFGGYYDPGGKGTKLQPGEVEAGGHKMYKGLQYAAWLTPMQIGATIAQFEGHGQMDHAALNIARGIGEETPLVGPLSEIGRAQENESAAGKYLGNYAKEIIEPRPLQDVAAYFDKDSSGKTVPRKVRGFRDEIKSGIPVLRKQIPRKQKKGSGLASGL